MIIVVNFRIKDATQGRADYEQQLNNLLKKLYELEAEEKLLEHRRAFLEEEIVALQSQNKRLNAEIERTLHVYCIYCTVPLLRSLHHSNLLGHC